jgi:glutaredoxin 3
MAEVEVYSASYCPYCVKAKELLKSKGIEFIEKDVTTDEAGRLEAMERSGGRKTVPQIFINNESIGGFDELDALNKSGELDKLVAG